MSARSSLPVLSIALFAIVFYAQEPSRSARGKRPPVQLRISGPQVIHAGENLKFTATLTNRSKMVIAVPSTTNNDWYLEWTIVDQTGKLLSFKPDVEFPIDSEGPDKTSFHDGDFILLKPGERAEYDSKFLGDPSNRFVFPRKGKYSAVLSVAFCAPQERDFRNGTVGYTCGITRELSQSVREIVLASPSFRVGSNEWTLTLE